MTGATGGLENLDELYESIILDHYRSPRNTHEIENPDVELDANNPFCGDELHLQLKFSDDHVADLSVAGRGCAISQSSASLLSEMIKGRSKEEIKKLAGLVRRLMKGESLSDEEFDLLGDIEALGGVRKFPVRIKCALLSWAALEDALEEFEKKAG